MKTQTGILVESIPPLARHLFFAIENAENITASLNKLAEIADGHNTVVGIGQSVVQALDKNIEKLRIFPAMTNQGIDVPSTQHGIWLWLRGDDRGEILYRSMQMEDALAGAFKLVQKTEAFCYLDGHDLSGYEDGTENPVGEEALEVVTDAQSPHGSYAAIQHWEHDLRYMKSLPQNEQDDIIGRRLSDNEEFEDAPESAHVKRTAMEDFDPEAFVVRRSMPYIEGDVQGLVFLAFGESLDQFEVQMRRMIGLDDDIIDGLFRYSRPVTGGYYWCPPVSGDKLDLSALGV